MPKDTKKKKVKGGMDAELEALLGQLSTLQVRVGGGSAGTTEASRAALARGGVGADVERECCWLPRRLQAAVTKYRRFKTWKKLQKG